MMTARDTEVAYRRAFDEFARWVEEVQFLTANPNPDRGRVTSALFELEKARAVYNHRRDEWAGHLLHSSQDSYHNAHQDQDEDRLCATRGR
ncbi:MAG TPA: hypothetical protein VK776_06025 [Bryobacteraceae bacterium]|jgi:hypothetical protein|nr:hypothetical protein [Bryobacteraceae bacterium]